MIQFILCLISCAVPLTLSATTQKAHIHGMATGTIIIDGSKIIANLEIPADSIVGFEYTPSTSEEKTKVKQAKEILIKENYFQFYTKTFFNKNKSIHQIHKSSEVTLSSDPKLNEEEHHAHEEHHHDKHIDTEKKHHHEGNDHDHTDKLTLQKNSSHKHTHSTMHNDEHESHDAHHQEEVETTHSEFQIAVSYEINAKQPITHVATSLFTLGFDIEKLALTIINNDQQTYKELTKETSSITLQ